MGALGRVRRTMPITVSGAKIWTPSVLVQHSICMRAKGCIESAVASLLG